MSEKNVQLNEEVIKGQIRELVRGSVGETFIELLKEADQVTQSANYISHSTGQCPTKQDQLKTEDEIFSPFSSCQSAHNPI